MPHVNSYVAFLLLLLAAISPDKSDERKLESGDQPFSFEAFILNGSSLYDVNKLWRIALGRERGKSVAVCQEENVKINKTSSSIMDAAHLNQKCKAGELSEGSAEDHPTTKKQRVTWTPERHKQFLEAISYLGIESKINGSFFFVFHFSLFFTCYLFLYNLIIFRCCSQKNS